MAVTLNHAAYSRNLEYPSLIFFKIDVKFLKTNASPLGPCRSFHTAGGTMSQ